MTPFPLAVSHCAAAWSCSDTETGRITSLCVRVVIALCEAALTTWHIWHIWHIWRIFRVNKTIVHCRAHLYQPSKKDATCKSKLSINMFMGSLSGTPCNSKNNSLPVREQKSLIIKPLFGLTTSASSSLQEWCCWFLRYSNVWLHSIYSRGTFTSLYSSWDAEVNKITCFY